MPKTRDASIVIDASVARACGQESSATLYGATSRDALKAIRAAGIKIVMTPDLMSEWKRHRSNYARSWLVDMFGRKRVVMLEPPIDESIRKALVNLPDKALIAVEKDLHIMDAALATSLRVLSHDREVRQHFAAMAVDVGSLKNLFWADPIVDSCQSWIANGLPDINKWKILSDIY